MGHERVVPFASDRPVVGAVGERALEPGRVQLDGDLGGVGGPLEAATLRSVDRLRRRPRVISSKKVGSSAAVSISTRCHIRTCGSTARERDWSRYCGIASRRPAIAAEPLGERRMIAGEQQEQAVADRVERERPALPDPQHVRVEDGAADVVQLQVALEAGGRPTGRLGSIASTCVRWRRSASSSASTASRPPSPSSSSSACSPRAVPRTGLSRTRRRRRASTRS